MARTLTGCPGPLKENERHNVTDPSQFYSQDKVLFVMAIFYFMPNIVPVSCSKLQAFTFVVD